jgi:hypothetical protein
VSSEELRVSTRVYVTVVAGEKKITIHGLSHKCRNTHVSLHTISCYIAFTLEPKLEFVSLHIPPSSYPDSSYPPPHDYCIRMCTDLV